MHIQNESTIKWKLFLEGDDNAYGWIYTNYLQILYQYGLQITPDKELVKDCIQDVFVKLYKNKGNLGIPKNIKIYLMIALKNSIYNAFRHNQIEESHTFTFYQSESYIVENDFINLESIQEEQHNIKKILSILTPRQREIIYYRFIEELDYEEICHIMNLNYQSAYNLLQRSLQKVRDTYGSNGIWALLFYQLFSLNP